MDTANRPDLPHLLCQKFSISWSALGATRHLLALPPVPRRQQARRSAAFTPLHAPKRSDHKARFCHPQGNFRWSAWAIFLLHLTRICAMSLSGIWGVKSERTSNSELMVMNFTRNKGSNWSRLTTGWCALLLYAGACSPPGLGLAALVGALDPNHQLLIGAGERGGRLVLHHGIHCAPHHHGLAARALTLLAQPASAANPDHILQFSSADTLKGQSQTSARQPESRCILLVFHGGEFLAHAPKALASGISLPPRVDAARLCLRSTVLLI